MDTVFKSLRKNVEQCVSEFNLYDFCPSTDNHTLAKKFGEILNKEKAFWEEIKPMDEWPR